MEHIYKERFKTRAMIEDDLKALHKKQNALAAGYVVFCIGMGAALFVLFKHATEFML